MPLPSLSIGGLSARLPIIQGGMGVGVSLSGLASAVANAGGIGVIATPGIGWQEPDFKTDYVAANSRALRKQIRAAKDKTKGIIGVNIMVVLTNFAHLVRAAVEERIDIIFSGAGLPLNLPELVDAKSSTKLVPIISSARAAKILCRKWLSRYNRLPDAFVVEGPKAGGHLGFKPEHLDDEEYALERLIPEVVKIVAPFEQESGTKIPVIAAGGVYSGGDIRKFLDMGASGVQMGTRFVATDECDADPAFKQAFVDADEESLTIVKSPVGMPGRAIRNEFLDDVEDGAKIPFSCPFHCIQTCEHKDSPYCIALALLNARKGSMKHGLVFAGANAHRIKSIVPVAQLMESLQQEYELSRQPIEPLAQEESPVEAAHP
ncbi:NAD(P)H-dependent flavin oxidoreductase [Oceanidesulfovibrio marinus]|uniref:Nitronate monooxygenase n=1 Tax=Oceanidesulfovibrio marinus TaxID=370038 RepID=A0A6P1ZC53_9BACT|nr:nitronate monooxygenase family protein [Oceanidesulfovibrio marinus]TVM31361.1 nitronate monooxygenase [Oceanidesulfovibrio marinus]